MKATELRIGNFVWDHYSGEMIVTAIMLHEKNGQDGVELRKFINSPAGLYNCKLIEPIPLSEEWLLKFGFKKANKKKDIFPESFIMDNIMKSRLYFRPSFKGGYYWGFLTQRETDSQETDHEFYDIEPTLYVHQLQNLYFALCGEELIIK